MVVRFVYGTDALQMTVEGDLPTSTVEAIAEELRERLSSPQNSPWTLTPLGV
ncbi:hypothetical protein [Nannocystis punicea]|uniref:Uncharacterized protein n=1 Tax=Nannocystis punicea TaxID=2995304 RepID=A0ABY7GS13_9BACT|nr:hypothetical protein [Nannocystis poenicansa]WAS89716.1 hypothetical protein O0S08_26280 [Nannocystis poenicansa]